MLEDKKIELPNPQLVAFSKFSEDDGWGKAFDGTKLSIVLKESGEPLCTFDNSIIP